jgi:rod shape determining protein RodA
MWKSVDWWTVAIYVALVIFGWFSVCGASYDYSDMDFFSFGTRAGKQMVWIGCSMGLGFILLMLEDRLYDMFSYVLYGAMMLLLFVTPFLAEDTKGSYSWLKFGPVSLQPAEFAKFATALAVARFMNVYGFTMSNWKHAATVVTMILLPMLLIIMQRETGSALVYSAFFLMLYREGMPGSILFAGICAVVYFVVGIRFSEDLMADGTTVIGEFSVLLLIMILCAVLVRVYCPKREPVWHILSAGVGSTLLAYLFSLYVIPFNVAYVQYVVCVGVIGYLLFLALRASESLSVYCPVRHRVGGLPLFSQLCLHQDSGASPTDSYQGGVGHGGGLGRSGIQREPK